MGTKLKFTGSSHERSFTKSDFKQVGVEGGAVRFDEKNNWVAEVDDAVAEYLLSEAPGEYREATAEDESERDFTRVGTAPRALKASADAGDDSIDSIPTSPGGGGDDGETAGTPAGGRSRGRRS